MQQRVMLKISGEQLGSDEYTFDLNYATRVASVVVALQEAGHKVACVMGGVMLCAVVSYTPMALLIKLLQIKWECWRLYKMGYF